jgi:uncharacterized protein YggE
MLSLFFVSRSTFVIKDNTKNSDTISVSGAGEVNAKPDIALFNFSFSELAPSSREAMDKVNQKVTQALKILKDNGIADKDVSTGYINLSTDYDYSNNARRILGQRAVQSINVKVRGIDDKATKATQIIDKLTEIENINLGGISFDIDDKTKLFEQARELAFAKAKAKASQLSKLASVSLDRPVSISDTTYDVSPQPYMANVAMLKSASYDSAGSGSSVPTGELTVTANLSILWGIK